MFKNEFEFDNFNYAYKYIIGKLLNNPDCECSPRGMKIKELLTAKIILANPRDRIISFVNRNLSLPYAIGEFAFYMRGENSLSTMEYYSKRIRDFSDDGQTINSAYGYRIFGHHPVINHNQWDRVKKQLQEDKDTRQAIIHIQTPDEFLKKTRDLTCTIYLDFLIRNNKLNMITHMRSNDIWWGSSYDVFNFTIMQELMSLELGVELGTYIHLADSLHLYEKNFEAGKRILNENVSVNPMPNMTQLEVNELQNFVLNEESIRKNNMIIFEHKSPIFKDFIKILYDYKKRKNDNNN